MVPGKGVSDTVRLGRHTGSSFWENNRDVPLVLAFPCGVVKQLNDDSFSKWHVQVACVYRPTVTQSVDCATVVIPVDAFSHTVAKTDISVRD